MPLRQSPESVLDSRLLIRALIVASIRVELTVVAS